MSGKHDKSVDDEQSPNLLLTGPIAIRGLGRGVKDAFVPGRPSRHRAFADSGAMQDPHTSAHAAASADGAGGSAEIAAHEGTQSAGADGTSFLSEGEAAQTDVLGLQEHHMDDRVEHAAPADAGDAVAYEYSTRQPDRRARPAPPAATRAERADEGTKADDEVAFDGVDGLRQAPDPADRALEDIDGSDVVQDAAVESTVDAADAAEDEQERGVAEATRAGREERDESLDADHEPADDPGVEDGERTLPTGADDPGRDVHAIAVDDGGDEDAAGPSDAEPFRGGPPPADPTVDEAVEHLSGALPHAGQPSGTTAEEERWTEPRELRTHVARSLPEPQAPSLSRALGTLFRHPARRRFDREVIGIVVVVVLALVSAVLVTAVVIKTRNEASTGASHEILPTLRALPAPSATKSGPVVAVIGDGSTSRAGTGVASAQRWTSLLASSLGGSVRVTAVGGMGYAAQGTSGETFVQAAGEVPADSKVVVFFGGAADVDTDALSLAKAATDAYATALDRAPGAKIVVIGPAISPGARSADVTVVRDTLRASALVVKATWVDPVEKAWLPAAKRSMSPDDLSASDEKVIAAKMQDAVKRALR